MIILTGASGGIGRELIGYLSEIDNVIGLFNKEPIHPLPGNSRITYEKLDLLDREKIETFVDVNKNRLSQITLVHGASIKIDELAIKYEEDAWDRVMGVNLKGNFLLTQALLPKMLGIPDPESGWLGWEQNGKPDVQAFINVPPLSEGCPVCSIEMHIEKPHM